MKGTGHLRTSVLVVAAFAGGCRQDQPGPAESFFPAEGSVATRQIFEAQIARGARSDATLYSIHFDETGLNSLGRAKLDAMICDNTTPLPITVYVDLPGSDVRTVARTAAVRDHLAAAGLLASQFRTEAGANPATLHSAAADLTAMSNLTSPVGNEQTTAAEETPHSGESASGRAAGISTKAEK